MALEEVLGEFGEEVEVLREEEYERVLLSERKTRDVPCRRRATACREPS